jgi:integrase
MPTLRITRKNLDAIKPPAGPKPEYHFDDTLTGFAVRVSPRGVKAFLVQGYAAGKLYRRPLGRYPKVAPESAKSRARAILDAMAGGQAPEHPKERVLVKDALDEWLSHHVDHKLKPRTREDYRKIADQVLRPALGAESVAAVDRAAVAKIHHDRRETPRRANYILAVCRSFFSYCEDAGHRPSDTNPARRIRAYPEKRRERFLSDGELAKAAAAISALEAEGVLSIYAAAALRLCLLTGARQGEIRTLRWSEVDLARRLLMLEDSKTGRRSIYLSEPACQIFRDLPPIEGNPYVIAGDVEGEPYKNLTRAWIKVRKRAGLPDVRLHDLRHTFASVGAAESLSLPMIGRLLGHRVPATTARYAHLAADPVTQANERVGARLAAVMAAKPAEEQTAEPIKSESADVGE